MLGVVRKNGTVIYRRAAGDPGFVDHGGQFSFPGQVVDSELVTRAIRAMPNTASPGAALRITGSAEFKRSVVEALVDERFTGPLADPELEQLLRKVKAERDAQQRSRNGPRGG
nr:MULTISPECIES: LPD7 domain-containing protein [Pseudomonas]